MKLRDLGAMRELPVQELNLRLQECEERLFRLRFAHAVVRVKNPAEIQSLRRHKARLMTWIKQKSKPGIAASSQLNAGKV